VHCSQAAEYRGDLSGPLPSSGAEPGVDVLALLGKDAGLNLSVRARVGDCYPVYPDVVVFTEIQELLPSELGAVVDDDRVGDPKVENNVLDKAYRLFGANFSQGALPRST
jgi:hypothetical protein